MDSLQDIEKALLQILIAYRAVESVVFDEHLECLRRDYPNQANNLTTSDIFKRINVHLRKISLEIKTVVIRSDDERKSYHGVVNTGEDSIATEFGSTFSEAELDFARTIISGLIDMKQIGTTEIRNLTQPNQKPYASNVIDALVEERWIVRNVRGYFELGPRSFLEIRPFLEAETAKQPAESSVSLPQILFY